MFCHTYYMDGPIQNVFPHILNGWPHTECFTKHTKWMAPYRMFFHTYYMVGPIQNVFKTCEMDGPIQNDYPNVLNGWTHTE